jgi:hypothetical protein
VPLEVAGNVGGGIKRVSDVEGWIQPCKQLMLDLRTLYLPVLINNVEAHGTVGVNIWLCIAHEFIVRVLEYCKTGNCKI